jgi:hypothetical protein
VERRQFAHEFFLYKGREEKVNELEGEVWNAPL